VRAHHESAPRKGVRSGTPEDFLLLNKKLSVSDRPIVSV
jgi:hypothetical protein